MASGQSARTGASTVSIAPLFLAAIVAMALLVGSLVGAGVISLGSRGGDTGARQTPAVEAGQAMVAIRAAERASEVADAASFRTRLAKVGPALVAVRADERLSEIPLDAVLVQIRADERASLAH
jgi:hypothetical protein